MPNYNELFGGDTVAPSQLSLVAYEISSNLTLQWPLNSDPNSNFAAAKIDITPLVAALSVTVPPANEVSNGTDILFNNLGAYSVTILNADGGAIGTVDPGEQWYYYVADNTTAAGTWRALQFGAATSSANAASLAGAGLIAILATLNQNIPTTSINADYPPGVGDRATLILSTGGVVVLTPGSPATLGDGWFVDVVNAGSGTLTWDAGGATVDGEATKVLNPDESATFFSDGSNFWTVGFGRAISSTVTATSISLAAASSPLTLSAAQVAAQVQDYSGALTGNFIVNYGTGAGYWFVRNNTSGAFSLTLRVNGSDAGVAIAQGSYSIVRSNGSNLTVAFTATSGTVTQVNTGTGLQGGPITTTGTVSLANTAVAAGTYGGGLNVPNITIDAQGRITSASNVALGSAAALTAGGAAGNVPVLNSNALLPSVNGGASTGDVKASIRSAIPGWILGFGNIGNASSGATNRANADTEDLFTLLWNDWTAANAPVSGGRGASAAADFAANKTIGVPDLRGVTIFGMSGMGGTDRGNLATGFNAPTTTPGNQGGQQTATASVSGSIGGSTTGSLSVSGNGNAAPNAGQAGDAQGGGTGGPFNTNNHDHAVTITGATSGSLGVSGTFSGTTAAMNTVPPGIIMNLFIKL